MPKKKKNTKSHAQRNARRAMKRYKTETARRKKAHSVMSSNAVQHQMMGQFGNVENLMRNVIALGEMFSTEPDLVKLRFDAEALCAKFDVTDRETNAALRDLYSDEKVLYYAEDFEGYWRDRRRELLPELVTDEFVKECGRVFDVLMQKKRGKKKEYRAAMAGKLLVETHNAALTEADVEDNNLWELVFNATLKEHKLELPELPEEPEETEETEESAEPSEQGEEQPAEEQSEEEPPQSEEEPEEQSEEEPPQSEE
ncbi:MAG: hypothetical protein P9M14_16070 [Candidatus Alcyoniella australis]|nr:hypothetical protein [Candidatus Alcyoniella australis]